KCHGRDKKARKPFLNGPLLPMFERLFGVRKNIWSVDENNWLAVICNIPLVFHIRKDILDETVIVFNRVIICQQNFVVAAIPSLGPVFVCPAETERKIDLFIEEDINWLLQNPTSRKPVIVETEAKN